MRNTLTKFIFFLVLTSVISGARAYELSDFPPLQDVKRLTAHDGGHRLDILVRHDDTRRPVLVVLPGSVCMPLFMAREKDGQLTLSASVGIPQSKNQQELGIHVAVLERRNLVSLEHATTESDTGDYIKEHPCTEQHGGLTLEHRVQDTIAQLEYLQTQAWAGPLLLAGFSEGSDVAAAVAANPNNNAQSLLLMSGAGSSQFFDFVNQARAAGDASGIAHVFSTLDAFQSGNPPKSYLGLAPERWQSFAINRTPVESLLLSNMPVFVVHGDQDTSVPIASVDMLIIELIRKQPERAILYWSIPGVDHSLRNNGKAIDDVYIRYVRWALGNPHGRAYHSAVAPLDSDIKASELPPPAATN
jgi:predicted esterase